jgi:microcin C transport system permease protein
MTLFDPIMRQRWQHFRTLRRGYWSLWGFVFILFAAVGAELWVSNRALMVRYEGKYFFPTYGGYLSGETFGLDYKNETDYRELKKSFEANPESGNLVVLPIVPYGPFENSLIDGEYPPYPPNAERRHFLGTDTTGRDVLARLVYGFRIAIGFSLTLLIGNFIVGMLVGSLMGYLGGWFDLILQRLIEIWANVPFLYVVIIVSSIVVPDFSTLVAILLAFGWMSMTWYLRTITYREKARDYIAAARVAGASHWRIILRHIIPNSLSLVITFVPFAVVGGITSLTALDFLGFGLPAPTPSWGELLGQGKENLSAVWIVGSVMGAMMIVLMLVTLIGEAVRDAFDPKQRIRYE